MPEPERDNGGVDAVGEERHGAGVAQHVRRGVFGGQGRAVNRSTMIARSRSPTGVSGLQLAASAATVAGLNARGKAAPAPMRHARHRRGQIDLKADQATSPNTYLGGLRRSLVS